jgi:hypothetical protein
VHCLRSTSWHSPVILQALRWPRACKALSKAAVQLRPRPPGALTSRDATPGFRRPPGSHPRRPRPRQAGLRRKTCPRQA